LRQRRARGFTLIEVLVAFVMLALIMVTAFEIFSTGMSRAGALAERAEALAVAQSRLAIAGMEEPLAEGAASGETEDRRYRWTTTIVRSQEGMDSPQPALSAFVLYHVAVRVDWRGGDARDHTLALATLDLGAPPQ
jgi:general secretion pathway protein I